jgi:ribosomal protein S18 acetylase RimI-like enzyme
MLELAAMATYGDLASLGRISLRERLDEIFDRHYAHDKKRIWIAFSEGKPIGLVWIQPGFHPVTETPDFLVLNLAVDPAHQGQGVGRQLMTHARTYAEARGVRRLRLFVASDNASALGLYEKLGFAERTREMVWDY